MNSEDPSKKEIKKDEADKAIEAVEKVINTTDVTNNFTKDDVNTYKGYAIMSYLFCLFLYPLLKNVNKKSSYVNFHVNQGLDLFLLELAVLIFTKIMTSIFTVRGVNTYLPGWVGLINYILYCIVVVLVIVSVINVSNGKSKELPYIGKYKFIKMNEPAKTEIKVEPLVEKQTEVIEIKDDEKI